MLIISQDFNWHDQGEGGTYGFGEDGYLTIDGSRGRGANREQLQPALLHRRHLPAGEVGRA